MAVMDGGTPFDVPSAVHGAHWLSCLWSSAMARMRSQRTSRKSTVSMRSPWPAVQSSPGGGVCTAPLRTASKETTLRHRSALGLNAMRHVWESVSLNEARPDEPISSPCGSYVCNAPAYNRTRPKYSINDLSSWWQVDLTTTSCHVTMSNEMDK